MDSFLLPLNVFFLSLFQDAFGNTVSADRLLDYAGRFSLRLSAKMGDETADMSTEAVNFVVYHTPGMETLSASMGFSPSKFLSLRFTYFPPGLTLSFNEK